jgi:hypothetical protein
MYKERAKWVAVQTMLGTEWHDLFVPATKRWTGRRMEFVERDDARVGTIYAVHKGELHAWYAPRFFVDQWNRDNSIQAMVLPAPLMWVNNAMKNILTNKNPAFWVATNLPRDVRAFNLQMPGTWKRWREYVPLTGGAFGEFALPAFRASVQSFLGKENPLASAAMARGMVISRAEGYWGERSESDRYVQELTRRGIMTDKEEQDALKGLWANLQQAGEGGQVFERTSKIAGMMYMDKYFPDMPEWEKRMVVRSRAGSPDFLSKPVQNPVISTFVGLYYNAFKEGTRSGWRTLRERPAEFAWNTARRVIWPTTLMYLIYGGLGMALTGRKKRTEEEEMFLSIPQSDRANFFCIPIRWTDRKNRKVLYARFSFSEPERILNAAYVTALRAFMGDQPTINATVADIGAFAGGQVPGPNPVVKTVLDAGIMLAGGNPVQRGRPMLTQDEDRVRGGAAWAKIAKMEFNQLFGGLFGRFDVSGEEPTSTVERVLRMPGVSASLGRVLKVSNQGWQEHIRDSTLPIAEQESRNRLEIDAVMKTFQRTGRIDPPAEVRAKLAEGYAALEISRSGPLPPDLALKRHYVTYYEHAIERTGLRRNLPIERRLAIQAPTSAQKMKTWETINAE